MPGGGNNIYIAPVLLAFNLFEVVAIGMFFTSCCTYGYAHLALLMSWKLAAKLQSPKKKGAESETKHKPLKCTILALYKTG
ncbi:hypothetical protein B6N25_11860 [Sphingobacteriales bacterium TSM_CSS]|nr:hypothetical protein B6N25_11860 [Sphingobacteriales bacterium TSM_CSS]